MSTTSTKIYDLYPNYWGTGFTAKSIEYHGTVLTIAATSIRQAYAVAHKDVWIDPHADHPVGIVSIYRRDHGTTLWCGCSGHQVTGGKPKHMSGIRALREAINAHDCPRSLRNRLLANAEKAGLR